MSHQASLFTRVGPASAWLAGAEFLLNPLLADLFVTLPILGLSFGSTLQLICGTSFSTIAVHFSLRLLRHRVLAVVATWLVALIDDVVKAANGTYSSS
jgi:hypothetical protein